ncbi:MAG: hypothetical protein ACLTWR_04985 [Agathobaculum desmolans]
MNVSSTRGCAHQTAFVLQLHKSWGVYPSFYTLREKFLHRNFFPFVTHVVQMQIIGKMQFFDSLRRSHPAWMASSVLLIQQV